MIQMAGGLEDASVSTESTVGVFFGAPKPARLKDTVPLELEWGTTNCFQTALVETLLGYGNFRCCCGRHLIV